MKTLFILAASFILVFTGCDAQVRNAKTASVKISGNCSICETAIEKAGTVKGSATVNWDKDTKMAAITYDTKKTTKEAILKRIALAGYDNELYLAPDEAYAKLESCCRYNRENKQPVVAITPVPVKDTAVKPADHSAHHDNTVQEVKQVNQLQPLFDSYFALKDALVKSDGNQASGKAASLLALIKSVKMESLETQAHMVWMKVYKDLQAHTESISKTKETAAQREHFASLSTGMYELVKAGSPATTVYYQHCPMYNDGKGANWLSKENNIKNPYYGSMMLTCGKTVETIQQ